MTALLDVKGLTVRFALPRPTMFGPRPHLEAVRQVSFKLQPGRALGIVGESGSGKTTTAMATIRLVNAAGGEVLFEGKDLLVLDDEAMRRRRRDMQLIFQDPYSSLNPRAPGCRHRAGAAGSDEDRRSSRARRAGQGTVCPWSACGPIR